MTTNTDFTKDHTLATALNLFRMWWVMNEAERELLDLPKVKDTDIILNFMGSGASCQVYARDIRLIAEIDGRRYSDQRNWAWPQLLRIADACGGGNLERAEEMADHAIEWFDKLKVILRVSYTESVDSFLALSEDEKRKWFGVYFRDTVALKECREKLRELRDHLIDQVGESEGTREIDELINPIGGNGNDGDSSSIPQDSTAG